MNINLYYYFNYFSGYDQILINHFQVMLDTMGAKLKVEIMSHYVGFLLKL